MLVKFNRRHRYYRAGQKLDIPDRLVQAWVEAGIVSVVRDEPSAGEDPSGGIKPEPTRVVKRRVRLKEGQGK